jgi:hypothetical protein
MLQIADYLLFGGMVGMALPCSDRPILRVFGPVSDGSAQRLLATLYLLGMRAMSYQKVGYP